MKRLSIFLLLLAIGLPWAANAQNTITLTGNVTQTIEPNTTYNFYDSGGPNSNYGTSQNYTATLTADGDITINFSQFVTESSSNCSDWDHMHIYDGTASTGTLLARGQTGCSTATLTTGTDYVATSGTMTIVWKSDGSQTAAGWAATITGGVAPACPKPKDLTCTASTGTPATATFTWTNGGTETNWVLEYGTASDFTGASSKPISQSDLVDGKYTLTTGLTAETKYYARIKADCGNGEVSDPSNTCEFKPTNEQTVSIGSGTGTNGNLPTNPYYNYSYTQQIYTAAEIDMVGSIKNISFKGNKDGTRSLTIYMVNTTKETFSSKTDVIPIADATQVFSGSVIFTANEWKTIELAGNGFDYEGDNLAIIVYDNTQNYTMGQTSWATFTATGNQAVYFYQDASITPSSPSANNNAVTTSKNQIKLSILPSNTPKPRNLEVVEGTLSSSGVTLQWQAPASGMPTGYEYQYKEASVTDWPATWTSNGTDLSKSFSDLTASTPYDFRVRATYAEGNSKPVETQFTTLDNCAFPTGFAATLTPGVGTMATFSWTKGFSEDDDWVLQYGTDNTFATCTEINDGFTVNGNTVTFTATTGITPEVLHYARVKTDCGSGSYSSWSDVYEFTPTNYVDFTFRETASSSSSYVPFYGYYTTSATNQSQFVIPAAELTEIAGGTIRSITYYTSSTATTNWGGVTFDVYMAEVENTTFSTATFVDWETLTNLYTGTVSLSNGMMTVAFDRNYTYNGGNLLIGFKTNTAGTATQSISWTAYYGSAYNEVHQYSTYSASRSNYQPKITFSYQPSPYKYPVIDEASCTAGTTSAHIAWTVTGATPTGYQYQYKTAAGEWPTTTWTSVTTTYADLSGLNSGTSYDFRVKALYEGNHESAVVDYSFFTDCAVVTAFPWKEDFEAYAAGDFSHPCWVNEHISGDGTNIFKVYTSANGSNTTHQLQLPDQTAGTQTKLRLPEMNLPGNNYQFVIDVYRNNSTYNDNYPYEGIRVFASTDGNIEGATELTFIPRQYNVSSTLIPEESEVGWYTYEIPIGVSGTCYIILRGESQYCTSTYMDNLTVEQIPTCARPLDLAYSDVTNHSAKLSWTAGDAEQTLWQVAYSKTSFDPNTANFDVTTVSTVDATANPFTLDKILDAASTYYVYVRANCGTAAEPDFGPWSRKGISFTTLAATPAPSSFVASNLASTKVDLVWNAGGGDTETWELYYVASSTDPEAPTATTTATVSNITTLPTTEAPYVLEGLNPVTTYYAWIRAKHVWDNETTYSDWVALTGNYFETLDACPTPTDLAYTNLTSVSADLSWVGSDDVTDYTVQYRVSEQLSNTVLNEEFNNTSAPTGWTGGTVALVDGVADLSANPSTSWSFGTRNSVLDGNHAWMNLYSSSSKNYWLVTPGIEVTSGQVLSFDVAYTGYSNSNPVLNCPNHSFGVYASTDKKNWTLLREWNNSGSSYVLDEISNTVQTVSGISLDGFTNETVYIGFLGHAEVTSYDNNIHVDNVKVGTAVPAGSWNNATTNETNQSYTLTGLTAGTKYDVQVKSNCTNGEWSEPVTFTTLADGTKVFTNAAADGKWGTAGNWAPTGTPVITDNAILRANATIESGCVAKANKITFENSTNLTIADGGQLQTDNSVYATVKKSITGYGAGNEEDKANYYLIGNPLSSTAYVYNTDITYNIRTGTYDLYSWSRTADLEWTYYGANNTSSLTMSNGTGYLYANAADVELTFTGTVKANNTAETKTPYYVAPSGETEFSDWNLFANPFVCDAYVTLTAGEGNANMAYYRMKADGSDFEPATDAIHPLEGFFVQATASSQSVSISRDQASKSRQLNVNLRSNNKQLDNAILVFGEGQNLGKFSFRQGSSKVYMPVEGNDYAALFTTEAMGALPVNFKAENNGVYTLSFTNEEVTFSYLHLIDNMTGIETDLLANPSYSFEARTTDYESRFKLVFATGNNANDDAFAFYSNGSFIINNEGEATLQVIDVNGRILKSESINGCANVNVKAAAGVYMLRLVNGNDVKVQKVVVR